LISVVFIGGEIGEKFCGNIGGFTGSLGGRHMLKRKENAPEWVIMPTSPIRIPVLL
jgi:hypothetical protein